MNELIIVVIGSAAALLAIILIRKRPPIDPSFIIKFAEKRKEKGDVALMIRRNGETFTSINPHVSLPLASTMKIILAIAFAKQVSDNKVKEQTQISKEELAKFYVEGTDGGAHKAWIQAFSNKESYSLKEIAIGMITYSSNANTELLMNHLGLDTINDIISSLELTDHSPIFPVVSALYIPSFIKMKEEISSGNALLQRLESMSTEEYHQYALDIHHQLAANKKEKDWEDVKLNVDLQKIWSDRLPAGSARDYMRLMQLINQRQTFDPEMQCCLEEILGYGLYLNEANRNWIDHGGMKGGSTLFVFTHASYTTDQEGNQTEIVFLSNQENILTTRKLQRNFNAFSLQVLKNEAFRNMLRSG